MIGKILESSGGKPCSCPSGKLCTACKTKKKLTPQVTVEEPHRLPIAITYYKPSKSLYQNSPHVQYVERPKRWRIRKTTKYEPTVARCLTICKWYKRRKALYQLKKEYEKEKERERQRKREEIKQEMMKELIHAEHRKKRTRSLPPKKAATVQIKERSAYVKPKSQSKYATVKTYDYRDTLTKRFVNFCYRFCCQLYCCLTCVLIVACSVIFLV